MACLQNLDEIEHVENSKHRTILLVLRDTNATPTEIAEQVGVQVSTIYYVARTYLPKGFLHMRKYQLQNQRLQKASSAPSTPNDPVHVVQPMDSKPSLSKRAEKSPQTQHPTGSTPGQTNPDAPKIVPACLTFEYGGATIRLEGEISPQHILSFCGILKDLKSVSPE